MTSAKSLGLSYCCSLLRQNTWVCLVKEEERKKGELVAMPLSALHSREPHGIPRLASKANHGNPWRVQRVAMVDPPLLMRLTMVLAMGHRGFLCLPVVLTMVAVGAP